LGVALSVLRGVFVAVAAGLGLSMLNSTALQDLPDPWPWLIFVFIVVGAFALIGLDVLVPRKRIELISCVYFGLVVGLILTYMLLQALSPFLLDEEFKPNAPVMNLVQLLLGVALCYVCISVLMQTKDDFRFIIPYVEFSKEVKGVRPYLLDTSVIIDGRIADLSWRRVCSIIN
jgi:uncharacterized protein YacL